MAENSKIEWCRHTFNPWLGCTKLTPACDNCYAEGWAKRTGQAGLWQGERRRTSAANWRLPLKWDRAAAAAGERHRVFCASLADVFDNQVPPEWRTDLWELIRATPNLDWMLLTKRPENIRKMLPPNWGDGWPNVWLGTTVEDAERVRRIAVLRRAPARIRFLSCEPLLGDLGTLDLTGIHLVISGGESGPRARPMHPAWARALRDQCAAAGVPFFFKQWGEWHPCEMIDGVCYPMPGHAPFDSWNAPIFDIDGDASWNWRRLGKASAGRLLDGREHNGMPA